MTFRHSKERGRGAGRIIMPVGFSYHTG